MREPWHAYEDKFSKVTVLVEYDPGIDTVEQSLNELMDLAISVARRLSSSENGSEVRSW